VSVKAVTPSTAAASPSHPEHARWVKDQTLKIESEYARKLGLSSRDAETENLRNLERLSNRKQKPRKPKAPRKIDSPEAVAASGVTQRAAPKKPKILPPSCKWCGLCLRCKREIRLTQITAKARELDQRAIALTAELVAIGFAANARRDYKDALGRELPFSRLKGHDRDKAVTAGAEWVCDRSTAFMGQWR